MEQITRKDFHAFCENFAHEFISSDCMMKEFRKLTCGDAQEVKEHLENHLSIDLRDWLTEKCIEIEPTEKSNIEDLERIKKMNEDYKSIFEYQEKKDWKKPCGKGQNMIEEY